MREARRTLITAAGLWLGTVAAAAAPARVEERAVADLADASLRRAVVLWSAGDVLGAAALLEESVAAGGANPRAAFLLACAYLRLGNHGGFIEVARAAAARGAAPATRGASGDDFGRWIAFLEALDAARTRGATAANGALDVAAGDDALARTLLAVATEAAGGSAGDAWARVAEAPQSSALDRELIGAARVRLATDALAASRVDAAAEWLRGVPDDCGAAPRARQMLGLLALERGDGAAARADLERLLAARPDDATRREVWLALGSLAIDDARWADARDTISRVEADWAAERATIARLAGEARVGADTTAAPGAVDGLGAALDPRVADSLWDAWIASAPPPGAIAIDVGAAEGAAHDAVASAVDLRADAPAPRPAPSLRALLVAAPAPADRPASLPAPDAARVDAAVALAREAKAARYEAARADRAAADEAARLARRSEYLARGLAGVDESIAELRAIAARLDALGPKSAALVARLARLRDEAIARIAARTAQVERRLEDHAVVARALDHFYVDGPNRERAERLPDGVPSAESLLAAEGALTGDVGSWRAAFAERAPNLVARSHHDVWEPRLAFGVAALAAEARRRLDKAARVRADIDSTLAASASSEALAAHHAAASRWSARADSLDAAAAVARRVVVAAAVAGASDALAREGEGIAYGAALAAHALGARDEAAARFAAFLADYPDSRARGEARFRLADLEMARARSDFETAMARFLGSVEENGDRAGETTRAFAPFVDYAPGLDLYRKILEEDSTFAHRDAVLFNVGMILSDQGDGEAEAHLRELVVEYPGSPFRQEAYLRMGDDRFDARDFAGCIPLYESAADGEEIELRAIALYKAGWAQFASDRFADAADAFRRLLDLYEEAAASGAADSVVTAADLRSEAEEYLVHSLARAGGAPAFRDAFDRAGARLYERRVLRGVANLLREFSLYAEATAADSLWLARYPTDPGAVAVARSLAETYERWNKPEAARASRLESAARFLDGGGWYAANASDSVREEGAAFARAAYRSAALHYHAAAREGAGAAEWREALRLHETLLSLWPDDPESGTERLLAGEASSALADFPRAIAHYEAGARADNAALAREAAWQIAATRDAWYESARRSAAARAATPDSALGPDSLAAAALSSGDAFAERYADDARCGDLSWRAGHLAYAHAWYERAAGDFERFLRARPRDERAPAAARLAAQALYAMGDYARAGEAFARAALVARRLGADSLAAALEPLVPLCAFQNAERTAPADSAHPDAAARLFDAMADRWPDDPHAPVALYRAGLGHAAAGASAEAVASWTRLVDRHPTSEYARDAHVQIAAAWERAGRLHDASRAYERYSEAYADSADAADALLKASHLLAAAGDSTGADALQLRYVDRFPDDVETAMPILATHAVRELAALGGHRPVSALLGKESTTFVARYLALAAARGDLADAALLARVEFLRAEETHARFAGARLSQPIARSLEAKKTLLEETLAAYRRCTAMTVRPWDRAAVHRIGQTLVEFGDALRDSERPSGLSAEDRAAYDEVLARQAAEFDARGEDAWAEMLREAEGAADDPGGWLARTREALWPRIALRFVHSPAVDYPLDRGGAVDGSEPALRAALERDPANLAALAAVARLDYDFGRHADAVRLIDAAGAARAASAERAPDDVLPAPFVVALALHCEALGEGTRARELLRPLEAPGAHWAFAGSALAYVALRGDAFRKSLDVARRALDAAPASAANNNNYGIALLYAGDPAGARDAFLAALRFDPWLPGALYNLAIVDRFYFFADREAREWFACYARVADADPDGLAATLGDAAHEAPLDADVARGHGTR
jgi:TolA-binding protein/tetratricopeptide (TPR) repeat protein